MDVNNLTNQELAMNSQNVNPDEYPKTDNYNLSYFDGDNYASFAVLSRDIVDIDTTMKTIETAATEKNTQITELTNTVGEMKTKLSTTEETANHANMVAGAASTASTANTNAINQLNTDVSQLETGQGTISGEVATLKGNVEANTAAIGNANQNITSLTNTVTGQTTDISDINSKINTMVSNEQKLSTGFNNYVFSNGTKKNVTFLISKESRDVYNIRAVLPTEAEGRIIAFSASADISSSFDPGTQLANISAFSYAGSNMSYGSITLSAYRTGSSAYLTLNYFGIYGVSLNIKVKNLNGTLYFQMNLPR